MLDPFAEKAFDAHNVAFLRVLPLTVLSWLARQMSQNQAVVGDSHRTLLYTAAEIDGLRTLNETQRKD